MTFFRTTEALHCLHGLYHEIRPCLTALHALLKPNILLVVTNVEIPLGPTQCCSYVRAFSRIGIRKMTHPGVELRESHGLWLASGSADVCGNTLYRELRGVCSNFHEWKKESRCSACHSYLIYYKKKYIVEVAQERQPAEQEFALRGYYWTVESDQDMSDARTERGGSQDICSKHFPQLPAQDLRERYAFLSAKQWRKQDAQAACRARGKS